MTYILKYEQKIIIVIFLLVFYSMRSSDKNPGGNTALGFTSDKNTGGNTALGFTSDNQNTALGLTSDNQNTALGLTSDNQNTAFGLMSDISPSWKNNLSKRWSKKQPSKSELCETFLDMKNSLIVQSNNIIGLNKRIERLEKDMADLIQYINAKL